MESYVHAITNRWSGERLDTARPHGGLPVRDDEDALNRILATKAASAARARGTSHVHAACPTHTVEASVALRVERRCRLELV